MERLISEERTLADLFSELMDETRLLVRQEIALAQAEIRATLSAYARDAAFLAIAAIAGLVAFQVLVATAILALALVLPAWASALIIGAVLVVVALIFGLVGWRDMRKQSLAPEQTIETLKEDREWIKDQME